MSPTAQVGTYDHNWHWYDATGQRMITLRTTGFNWAPSTITTGGARTFYVYDGNDVALSLLRDGGGSWSVKSRYLVGGLDNAVAGRFHSDAGLMRNLALINDRQGTTLAAMRGDGTQEDNVSYFTKDPYGGLIGASGPESPINTETGFAGASTPNASGGFVYLRNRWYDPKTGKFLTQDPIGLAGGVNLYSYAGNDPVNFSDPFGLSPDCADPKTLREAFACIGTFTAPLHDLVENKIGEITGVNELGRAAEAAMQGDFVGAGVSAALSLPIGRGAGTGRGIVRALHRADVTVRGTDQYAKGLFRHYAGDAKLAVIRDRQTGRVTGVRTADGGVIYRPKKGTKGVIANVEIVRENGVRVNIHVVP